MSSQDPYDDDEPTYLDLGKWLRIAVTAASALALLALIVVAATDPGPSLPLEAPPHPTAVLPTSELPDNANSERGTATPTVTPTPTPESTPAAPGAATASPESIREMVETAVCNRLTCSEFPSRTELDSYLLQCPSDYGKFDRDGDGRTCYDADDW